MYHIKYYNTVAKTDLIILKSLFISCKQHSVTFDVAWA